MGDESEHDEIETKVAEDEHDANELPVQSASGHLAPQSPKPPHSAFHVAALKAPSTPTSHESGVSSLSSSAPSPRAPEPPRWRFATDRKRAAGYDSSAAGMVVEGLSAEELGAKYFPPEIDYLARKGKEEKEVGKLNIDETKNDGTSEGLRGCLRSLIRSGAVTDSDDDLSFVGDVEVGSDFDNKSAVESAVVLDDKVPNQYSIRGNEGPMNDQNKKRKASLLGLLLIIAVLGMILGVTWGTQDEDDNIQSSEAAYLSKETETNSTISPSPTQNEQLLVTSAPPSGHYMPPTEACVSIARKVKIVSTTSEYLHMLEVRVISNGINIAIGKPASQSSDYAFQGGKTLDASLAVDGDLSTFSHTGDSNAGAWWLLDLQKATPVEAVLIVNRYCTTASSCLCRLSYAVVQLLSEHGEVIAQESLDNTCEDHNIDVFFSSVENCTSSRAPFADPSRTPSHSPSSFPSIQVSIGEPSFSPIAVPVLQGYDYIGMGCCLDSEGNIYDRYYSSLNTNDECAAFCTKTIGFRGFTVEDSSYSNWSFQPGPKRCNCFYDKGLLYGDWNAAHQTLFPVPEEYQGGSATTPGGTGVIASSDGSRIGLCYRYMGEVSPFPTITPRVPSRSIFP